MGRADKTRKGRRAMMSARPAARNLWFLLLWVLPLVLLRVPLSGVVRLALTDERHSHILLIPIISGWVVWLKRKSIFSESQYCLGVGIPIVLVGFVLAYVARSLSSSSSDGSLTVLALNFVWIGAFTLIYGKRALRNAIFPALFLQLMIPIPNVILEKVVFTLQRGSAEMAHGLFRLVGVPVFRDGFRFSLPSVEIEIAEECSGIRSSLSLLISGILAGHLLLRSNWKKLYLVLLIVPVVIFKNALRIVTISWLGVYVDREFLYGNLHRYGGLPFSFLALIILGLALYVLQKSEDRSEGPSRRDLDAQLEPMV